MFRHKIKQNNNSLMEDCLQDDEFYHIFKAKFCKHFNRL